MTLKIENRSGIEALAFRLLVLVDQAEEVTTGGLILPDTTVEREGYQQARGVIVHMGGNCFDNIADELHIGDRIVFPKYEGTEVNGADGKLYRLIQDEYIIGKEV